MPSSAPLPQFDEVLDAAARIAPHARVTPVLRADALDAAAGASLVFKAEGLQHGGAFKFRGACNAVACLSAAEAANGVVTHSSGNHGAALGLAARLHSVTCHVVVPEGATAAKLALVAEQGAVLHRCAPTMAAREEHCARIQAATGATLVHPYADPRVIAGQGTATLELLAAAPGLDVLVVPVGGGGLAAGAALALSGRSPGTALVLAEPAGAADTARALRDGRREPGPAPDTVCDGLRADLGEPNFRILQALGAEVLTVDDADTLAAMRLLVARLKLLVEPSSAVALAAVLAHPARFAGRRVGIVLTGGNVDPAALPWAAA